jgi:phenylalanine-4-hydroxylase
MSFTTFLVMFRCWRTRSLQILWLLMARADSERCKAANLARLYWYTVEFGLIRTPAGLRIFGAGILSSVAECEFALESSSPNRVAFDLERVMRTKYAIDDFQQTYFVFESFEDLLAACYQDFGTVYERLAAATDIEPFELIEGDEVLTRGTLAYFNNDQHSRLLQAN